MKMWQNLEGVDPRGVGAASPVGHDAPSVDLARLLLLADACGRVAEDLRRHSGQARAVAATTGQDLVPGLRLMEMAEWAASEQHRLRGIVARMRSWVGPGLDHWSVTDAAHPAHRHPVAAHAAAATVAGALRSAGGPPGPEIVELLGRWATNPVFAAELASTLGPGGVVDALVQADAMWPWVDERGSAARGLAHHLGATLATAGRHHPTAVTVPGLVGAAATSRPGLRVLGGLFVGRHRFSTAFLTGSATAIALPLMRARAATGRPEVALLGGAPGGRDVPAMVIDRVARDGEAARATLASVDLDDLLGGDHGDAGFAVARLLRSATTPPGGATLTSGTPLDHRVAEAGANLARLTRWMATTPTQVPMGVELSMGRILGPWIGSVRGPGLDGASMQHAAVDETGARRMLGLGMRWSGVRHELVAGAWEWAATESSVLAGRARPGAGFAAVGSVLGIVTVSAHDSAAARAASADERRAADREVWGWVQKAVLPAAPPVVRVPAGAIGGPLRERVLPDTDLELAHWRDERDARIDAEALVVEQVVLQALHGSGAGRVPRFLVERGRVRPLWSLTAPDRARYDRWRDAVTVLGPAPVQLAVERFLAEGREPRPAAPDPVG